MNKHKVIETNAYKAIFALFLMVALTACGGSGSTNQSTIPDKSITPAVRKKVDFRVCPFSDAHVDADIKEGRESMTPLRGTIGSKCQIYIEAGDLTAGQFPPDGISASVYLNQRPKNTYSVAGNHDASYFDMLPWFETYVDNNNGSCEVSGKPLAYKVICNNVVFLMLSDENRAPSPVGRGLSTEGKFGTGQGGGFPGGAVTRETYDWWAENVIKHQNKIIITVAHHMLRGTTLHSGYEEGRKAHGTTDEGRTLGGYLAYIIESWSPFTYSTSRPNFPGPFEQFLMDKPGAIDMWIGGHSHVTDEFDTFLGRGIVEEKWGVTFANVSGLTLHHAGSLASFRMMEFKDGSDSLTMKMIVGDSNQIAREWIIPLRNSYKHD